MVNTIVGAPVIRDGVSISGEVLKNTPSHIEFFNNILALLDSISFIPKIHSDIEAGSKNFSRIVNAIFLPLKIQSVFQRCYDAIKTNRVTKYIYTALDVIADLGFMIDGALSAFDVMEKFKWIAKAPIIPFFEYVLLPCSTIMTGLRGWDLFKMSKTFWVIQGGSPTTKRDALIALKKLHNHGVDDIEENLGLSEQCKLANRVDSLMQGIRKNKPAALKKVQEFYATMKERATLKLSLSVARMAASVTSLAGQILLLAVPYLPVVGGVMAAVGGIVSYGFETGETLFVKDDIFNKKAKCLAGRIKDWLGTVVETAGQKITALGGHLVPCAA